MKVKLKTLRGEIRELEALPTDRIGHLKARLAEGDKALRIIHKGKNLSDEQTLLEAKYEEGQIMILMAVVRKDPPKKKEEKEEKEEKDKEEKKEMQIEKNPEDERLEMMEGTIVQLMQMGFSREDVVTALRVSRLDANRAVELLLNGMVNYMEEEDLVGPEDNEEDAVRGLLESEEFKEIRQMLRQDPQADISGRVQALAEANPEVLEFLETYSEEDVRQMILDQVEDEQAQVVLSEADREAIQRLHLLGFSLENASTAYLACERNEEMAANYLFEQRDRGEVDEEEDYFGE